MLKHSWRSRFVARLVSGVSKPAPERAAAHRRLFPYGIADQLVDPLLGAKLTRIVPPIAARPSRPAKVAAEQKNPAVRQVIWHFNRRDPG